jgi:hypothetical protein
MGRAYGSPHGCAHVVAGLVRWGLPPGFFGKMPPIPTAVGARALPAVVLGVKWRPHTVTN